MKLLNILALTISLAITAKSLATDVKFAEEEDINPRKFYTSLSKGEIVEFPFVLNPFSPIKKPAKTFAIIQMPELTAFGRLVLTPIESEKETVETAFYLYPDLTHWELAECIKKVSNSLKNEGAILAKKYFGIDVRKFKVVEIDFGNALQPILFMDAGWAVQITNIMNRDDFRVLVYQMPTPKIAPSAWQSEFYNKDTRISIYDVADIVKKRGRKPFKAKL